MLRTPLSLGGLWFLASACACASASPGARPDLEASTIEVPAPATSSTAASEPIPALRLPSDVRPTGYRLELHIDPSQPRFSGEAEIAVELDAPRQVLWLHGRDLRVTTSAIQQGAQTLPARYEQVNDDGVVRLSLPRPIGPGAATIKLAWSGDFDPRVVGLYLAKEAGTSYAFTQFEDIFARRAFPSFDEPGFKTPFEVSLVVRTDDVAVANTAPRSEEPAGPGLKRIRFAPTRPLPTYLVAWAVGPFDVVEAAPIPPSPVRAWPVPLRGIAPKGRGGELGFSLKTSSELLLLEEAYFGIAYPYPKLDAVAVPDFAYGAMENAGAIHYREDLLLFVEGRTPEESRSEIVEVIAHEQAHQWFGNLVTMPWWEEAWLNESFATWFAARMEETWRPELHAAIDFQRRVNRAMGTDALTTARAIRQPLTSVKSIGDQFDALTYQKGGGVLAMFEHFVGAEPFRQGVSAYLRAHADGSGSTDELLEELSKASGQQLAPAFHTFLDQAGVPLIQASMSCAPKPVLSLRQSRYLPVGSAGVQDRTWRVPVCARFAVGGQEREQCTLLTEAQGSLELPGCPRWLIPNAGGVGYYQWSLAGEDLRRLSRDGYARLDVRERISLASALRASVKAGTMPVADALAALGPIAADPEGEVALEAIPLLQFVRENVVPSRRAAVDAYTLRLFAPTMKRLGFAPRPGENASSRRLRVSVVGLLAEAQDPWVLKEASRLGRAYAGLGDGRFHPEAVDPDLAPVALGVAVETGDDALFDALLQRLATTDDVALRGQLLSALGQARDPRRSARALALSLDPALRVQEGLTTVFVQSMDHRTRDAAWRFLKENFDALALKVPPTYAAHLPYAASGFCDLAHADEARAFFSARAEKHNGMERNVRQVDEMIRLCVTAAEAQRASAERFFSATRPAPPAR